jgi:type-F conjugative transfer system pilin assembly protein TrbC
VQIDPTTFRKYNITAVPVLIVACGNQGDKVDRLQGDLTLHQALKRVAEEGDCAQTAKACWARRLNGDTPFTGGYGIGLYGATAHR